MDSDEAIDLVDTFEIMRVTTLVTLKKGAVLDKYNGFLEKKELRAYLEKILSEANSKRNDQVEP